MHRIDPAFNNTAVLRLLTLCHRDASGRRVLSLNTHAGPLIAYAASVLDPLANNAVPHLSSLAVQVQDEQFARVRVLFETGSNQGYQFKTHPNIDKQLYASNVLGLKDSDRPFPTGSALPILKWRMQVCCPALRSAERQQASCFASPLGSFTDSVPPYHGFLGSSNGLSSHKSSPSA